MSPPWPVGENRGHYEVMQMDAAMGAVWAVCELLVQDRGDRIAVLPSLPSRWAELEFDGIRAPGAFLVGATVRRRRVVEVRIESPAGGELVIELGLGAMLTIDGIAAAGPQLRIPTRPGQRLVLRRV